MSLLTGLPSAICCFFTGINIPIKVDICKSFMIYFQIFTTFRYKSLKNSDKESVSIQTAPRRTEALKMLLDMSYSFAGAPSTRHISSLTTT